MNFFKRFSLGVSMLVKTTLGDLPRNTFSNILGGGNVGRRANVDVDPYGNLAGWAYYAIDRVAQAVASIDLELFRLGNEGELDQVFDHEVLSLLYRANPYQTKHDFFYMLTLYLRMWGSAPIWVETNKQKKPINLWPLRPDLLQMKFDKDNVLAGYTYRTGANDDRDFSKEEIIYIKKPSPQSLLRGYSVYFATAYEIDADMSAAVWNKYLMENAAEPRVILTTEQQLTDDQYKQIMESWLAKTKGPENAGQTVILEGGLKPERMTQNPQEMDFVNSRKQTKEAILTQLGVPPSLVDPTANRANADTAKDWFNSQTVEPIIRLITEQLNEFFIVRFDDRLWLSFESPVTEDRDARRLENQVAVNVWKTINEVREEYNLEPMDGGDVLYMPLGVMATVGDLSGVDASQVDEATVEQVKQIKARGGSFLPLKARAGFKSKKQAAIIQKIMARTYFKRTLAKDLTNRFMKKFEAATKQRVNVKVRLKAAGEPASKVDPEGNDLHPKTREDRKVYLKRLPGREDKFKKVMKRYFAQQEKLVSDALANAGEPKAMQIETKGFIDKIVFDSKKQIALLVQMTKGLYESNVEDGGDDIAEAIGTKPIDILKNPAAVEFLKDKPFKFASEVNETTEKALREALQAGLDAGEDLGAIGNRISGVFDIARSVRTETIARTEVGSALNFGRNTEMTAQGIEKKMWVTTFINSREDHEDAHGQIVGIDETFEVGGEDLEYPQDPAGDAGNIINCQCSVSPYFKD